MKARIFSTDATRRAHDDWARSSVLPLLEGIDKNLPILELGCGSGDLLAFLAKEGYAAASGIEPASEAAERGLQRGLRIVRGQVFDVLRELPEKYGAIVALDLVALDLVAQLGRTRLLELLPVMHDQLLPGGVLIVKALNRRGLDAGRLFGSRPAAASYTPESLEELLRLTGFEDVVVRESRPKSSAVAATLREGVVRGARALSYLGTGRAQQVWTSRMLCRGCKPGTLPRPLETQGRARVQHRVEPVEPIEPRPEAPPRSAEGRARVLLIGQALEDMMMDSYRRALSPHYDVKVVDPFSVLADLEKLLFGAHLGAQVNHVAATFSRLALGSEIAPAESRILREAEEFEPDLILTDCVEVLHPKLVTAIRKACPRAKALGRFGDAISNFGRGYVFVSDYDRVFFKDHYIVDKLRAKLRSTTAYYLPQACDRHLHRRVELTDAERQRYGCDIAVYGNAYLYRMATLAPLLGRDVKVWGGGMPRWATHPTQTMFTGHYVAGDEKSRAMLAAKIALNPNHYAEIQGTNKRTFELAAVGAFQLTDTPALSDVFDPETEVASYGNVDDLLDKLDYYLARPELRAQMADRAHARAHASHTYEHRWVAMLETIGLRPPADFPVQPEELPVRAV